VVWIQGQGFDVQGLVFSACFIQGLRRTPLYSPHLYIDTGFGLMGTDEDGREDHHGQPRVVSRNANLVDIKTSMYWKRPFIGNIKTSIYWKRPFIGNIKTSIYWKRPLIGKIKTSIYWKRPFIGKIKTFIHWKRPFIGKIKTSIYWKRPRAGRGTDEDEREDLPGQPRVASRKAYVHI